MSEATDRIVFTTILKTKQYTELLDAVLQRNLYSEEALSKRADKEFLWSTLSRLIYNKKFPNISGEIEKVITEQYFPTRQDQYVRDFDFTINISNENEHFWRHAETLKVAIVPEMTNTLIKYSPVISINLPDYEVEDITDCRYTVATLNRKDLIKTTSNESLETRKVYSFTCAGQYDTHYDLHLERFKIMCKKTNPSKTFRANQIIHNMRVTVIHEVGINIVFFRSGTVDEFEKIDDYVNGNVRIRTWRYEGLIFPHQGYVIVIQ